MDTRPASDSRRSLRPRGAAPPSADALVVGVIGAVGGAGASVFAAALARSAGDLVGRALLLGADPVSGGLGRLFAGELGELPAGPDLGRVRGRLLPGSLASALPAIDGVSVLDRAGPAPFPADSGPSVLDAALRDFDAVIADLPRHLDDVAATVVSVADLVVLLVPATGPALRAAPLLARELVRWGVPVRAVVRGAVPAGLTPSSLAELLGLEVAVRMAAEPGLARALARGEPPGLRRRSTLAVAARSVLRRAMAEQEPGDRSFEVRRRAGQAWLEELVGHD